ncbi:MFS transporter [Pseudomonas flexibilis]|uniref:MFS transporter n=1 Tax=Pseudomonas flexibilis TaxID=706570 RepID=UPI00068E40E2|nr:MFS transporter [Pseudomonas flexibilis]SCY23876.1 Predicted arabinose efflux permease, MFS family [Pseudomonas flexibilis]
MQPLAHPLPASLTLLAALYVAQGLPSGLMAHALPVLLRQQGVDLALISLLKLLALPWLLKVLWAPWIDRLGGSPLGHRRGWILPLQAGVALLLIVLAWLPQAQLFGPWLPLLLGLLLLINLAAATQDVATDGLTVRLLPERWRGLGNSLQVGGYKVGMLAGGSGLLLVADDLGWRWTLLALGLLVLLLLIPLLRFPERRVLPFHAECAEPAGVTLPWRHYRGLLVLPGMGLWLLVLLSFKLGDALGSPMIKPMLVDQGWGAAALGQLTLLSSLLGIGGALAGGWLYGRIGVLRALLLGGLLQAIGIAGMALLIGQAEVASVYAVALFEQFADGLSTVVLFAAMMRQCRAEHEGADFTLQASVQLLLGGIVGAFSGVLAKLLGYPGLFLLAGGLGVMALGVVLTARGPLRGGLVDKESVVHPT